MINSLESICAGTLQLEDQPLGDMFSTPDSAAVTLAVRDLVARMFIFDALRLALLGVALSPRRQALHDASYHRAGLVCGIKVRVRLCGPDETRERLCSLPPPSPEALAEMASCEARELVRSVEQGRDVRRDDCPTHGWVPAVAMSSEELLRTNAALLYHAARTSTLACLLEHTGALPPAVRHEAGRYAMAEGTGQVVVVGAEKPSILPSARWSCMQAARVPGNAGEEEDCDHE